MVRPDPIPNSAVKHRVADGSASIGCARVGRRQIYFHPMPPVNNGGLFLFHPHSTAPSSISSTAPQTPIRPHRSQHRHHTAQNIGIGRVDGCWQYYVRKLSRSSLNPLTDSWRGGNLLWRTGCGRRKEVVGAGRFELPTSCTRNKRANQAALRPEPEAG